MKGRVYCFFKPVCCYVRVHHEPLSQAVLRLQAAKELGTTPE